MPQSVADTLREVYNHGSNPLIPYPNHPFDTLPAHGYTNSRLVICSPPGYLILVNSGGPFFNGLPMFQSIGISKDYTQQIDAIRGGTERAQVFLLLHELGHLFGITRNDNGTTDDKTNQAWNNDALWLNCGSIIQGFSNPRK